MKLLLDQFNRILLITNDKSAYSDRLRLNIAIIKLKREIGKIIYKKLIKPLDKLINKLT